MKLLVILFLFLCTFGLLGGSFYQAIFDHWQWPYFLGAGIFCFLLSAAIGSALVAEGREEAELEEETPDNQ